jgi:hypothetical protein
VLLAVAACVDPLTTQATNSFEWDAKNVKAYAETVAGLPPEVVLARNLHIGGGVARWQQCTAVGACEESERERPANDVLAIEHVRSAGNEDAGGADWLSLSLAPRSKYIVPLPVYVRASRLR